MKGQTVLQDREESLRQTIEEARKGSREAFDDLICCFEKDVMKMALYVTGNLDDASDVAQEVYIKLVRHLPEMEDTQYLTSWILRVTVNTSRDLIRKRRFWEPLKRIAVWARSHDTVQAAELRNHLIKSLGKLSFNERCVFVLKELHEADTSEVCEIMGCAPATVRWHLHSAKKKLREFLKEYESL